jgi:hypothetical protein
MRAGIAGVFQNTGTGRCVKLPGPAGFHIKKTIKLDQQNK